MIEYAIKAAAKVKSESQQWHEECNIAQDQPGGQQHGGSLVVTAQLIS
jgi:hypothetical protein